jgi:hypothetical protein
LTVFYNGAVTSNRIIAASGLTANVMRGSDFFPIWKKRMKIAEQKRSGSILTQAGL